MSDDIKSSPANVSPGDKIAGYRLEEQIGQGGMAVVYRAHDERLDRRVALKLLAPGLAADTAFRTRFIRESRAAAAVDHQNIIPVYDAGDAGGFLFIAMRYVSGGDVRSLLSEGQQLPPERVWNIVNQVAAALDAAHEHDLIHRDVKPANMLLEGEHVYLSDFGISKQTLASHLTSTGQFVGTLDYIAPEQIEAQSIDGRVDQYSLACATYELLTGEPPFRRDLGLALINAHLSAPPPPVSAKRPGLPPAIDQVLAKAMAKSPHQRYASCVEFATDLGKAIGTVPGTPSVAATTAQPTPGVGDEQAKARPATELASPGVLAAGAAAAQAAQPLVAAVGFDQTQQPTPAVTPAQPTQWPAGTPGSFDAATQYAQTPPPGQTPPPQQQQPGYVPYPPQQQQYQPYQTGPVGPPVQPPYQTGPVGAPIPGWQQPPQPPQPQKSRGVLIGAVIATVAVAAAVVAVVAFVVLPKHPSPPNPNANGSNSSSTTPPSSQSSSSPSGPTAQSEATTINNLLVNSAQSRSQWNANVLVSDVGSCVALGSDITQIGDIAKERRSELNQAQNLQVGAIPNGSTLKSQLMAALQISLNIDNDYLAWARQQQNSGCTVGTGSTYYQDASNEDSQATADKTTFLGTWDPIASTYGLEQFNASQI